MTIVSDSSLVQIQREVYENSKAHGFWNEDPALMALAVPVKLVLVHSEVSEVLEAWRRGQSEHIGEELADVIIRVADLAQHLRIDLGLEVALKHAKNIDRPYMHGGKRI